MAEKRGRKRIEIDEKQLHELASIHCTQAEAAGVLGVSLETLKNRLKEEKYREVWDNGLMDSKASLRRTQFDLAKKNATMAIFLGKQYLDQKDVVNNELNATVRVEKVEYVIVDPASQDG